MYLVYKISPSIAKQRLTVKGFKDPNARGAFLCQGDNGLTWRELDSTVKPELPTRPGTYAYAGGKWHNVKHLDISVLAHI